MIILFSRHDMHAPRGTNDNGTSNGNLPTGAIIVFVLLAAGFAVLVGYSITRFYFRQDYVYGQRSYGYEQARYMRAVRQRNVRSLRLEHK